MWPTATHSLTLCIFSRHGLRARASNIFLLFVTVLMFLGGTIFLCLDISDLVRRMQVIMVDNPGAPLQDKLDSADDEVKKLLWIGEMLFVFMVRTWETNQL